MRKLFIFTLLFQSMLLANSSSYTSLDPKKCDLVYQNNHSNEYACHGPEGYSLHVLDGGGMQLQFDIKRFNESLSVWSADEPKVVEYRYDKDKKVIGLIIRIYHYLNAENFDTEHTGSQLYVYSFKQGIKLLGKTSNNKKARDLLDTY